MIQRRNPSGPTTTTNAGDGAPGLGRSVARRKRRLHTERTRPRPTMARTMFWGISLAIVLGFAAVSISIPTAALALALAPACSPFPCLLRQVALSTGGSAFAVPRHGDRPRSDRNNQPSAPKTTHCSSLLRSSQLGFASFDTDNGGGESKPSAAALAAATDPSQEGGGSVDASPPGGSYTVRDCQYRELKQVADLVVESFYDKATTNIVARNLYKLAELNRLQQNYAYPESRTKHRMLVVVEASERADNAGGDEGAIVGFCDVDARPCRTKLRLPRPYLSDLAVDPNHRRKGLARKLVEESERFVSGLEGNGNNEDEDQNENENDHCWLWIRVEATNEAALGLYRDGMGYSRTPWSVTDASLPVDTQARIEAKGSGNAFAGQPSGEPEVWTLRKDLASRE